MADYLREEAGDAVSAATLRRFCEQSAGMVDWLAGLGVPFDARLCPYKTSYPTNRHYLYFSGSELAFGQSAPRGHRVLARGTSGRMLYARLAAAARARGVQVLAQTRAERLVTDAGGRVTGVECRTLRGAPGWARIGHRVLHHWSVKPGLYLPGLGRALHRPVAALERRYGRPLRVSAGSGVILCAGGFVFDREMMRAHAPEYRGGLRLGTPGDDGSGIRLGVAAGARTAHLDRVSIWRFLSPPSAMLDGLLVDRDGTRICDESRYGAAVGEAILRSPATARRSARRSCGPRGRGPGCCSTRRCWPRPAASCGRRRCGSSAGRRSGCSRSGGSPARPWRRSLGGPASTRPGWLPRPARHRAHRRTR
jgi:3-oxo-5alpha-steroid 4-dehydrogenase